tara:strand:- start:37478 stop:38110 length:633 start_codon:yes stop_codon:yes gene_type:complete
MPVLISRYHTRIVVKYWSKIILILLENILNVKIYFDNKYLKDNKGQIIAANHQSAFDTIFFLAVFDKTIYIIKRELMFIPIYGWYAMRLGNVFINRRKKIESIRRLSKNIYGFINKGYKVVIFPEGTRQQSNTIGDIKPGAYLLQNNLKMPIFPVYIRSGKTWPKNSLKMKQRNIFIESLKPIPYGLTKRKFKLYLKKALEESIKKNDIN